MIASRMNKRSSHVKSFYVHWSQRLSKAAAIGDAAAIAEQVVKVKMQACAAANAATLGVSA